MKDDIQSWCDKDYYMLFHLASEPSSDIPTWSSSIAGAITIGFGGLPVGAQAPIVLTSSAIGS